MNKQNFQNKPLFAPVLYTAVFRSKFSGFVVFLLVASFLLQPIERVRADESVAEHFITPIATDEPPTTVLPDRVSRATTSEPRVLLAETSDIPSSTDDETGEIVSDNATGQTTADIPVISEVEANASSSEAAESPRDNTTEPVSDTNSSDQVVGVGTETPDSDLVQATELSMATNTATNSAIAVSSVTSDSVVQFNKSDCIVVSDGSFYCQNKTTETTEIKNGLSAKQDIDGDLEIFLVKDGIETQMTFNTVDDAAPFFDSVTNTIVLHRLIDDRYQIIVYDIESASEQQITADGVNNMEPTRSGRYIVWQHWNNDNWDIMLYDGVSVSLLTDTPQHDIAPNIRGNLVMWNRLTSENVQTIELYDVTSQEYTSISDTEGGALSNPRMVLVYEAEFQNGDIVTKGYDVETGEITPLSTLPAELPDELPAPDSTGETRALIQNKNPSKEDVGAPPNPNRLDRLPGPDMTSSDTTATTTTLDLSLVVLPEVLDMSASKTQLLSSTSTPTNLDEMELIVPPFVPAEPLIPLNETL